MKAKKIIQFLLVLVLLVGAIGSVAKSMSPAQLASVASQRAPALTMAGTDAPVFPTLPKGGMIQPCVGWNS